MIVLSKMFNSARCLTQIKRILEAVISKKRYKRFQKILCGKNCGYHLKQVREFNHPSLENYLN